MSQAFHGGRLLDAEREFGLPRNQFIDFSSNLNVFAPSVSASEWECWVSHIGHYPEADLETLRHRLAEFYRISSDCVLPTSGASEALYLAARLFAGRKVAILEPGFSDYRRSFDTVNCECAQLILPQTIWYEPIEKWAHMVEPFDVVVLGNPNNPTGSLQRLAGFTRLFAETRQRSKSWIIDEAFLEFIEDAENETLLSVIETFPSLIVVRSLTKSWCIPGLRLGFLATAGSMELLRRMQPPWSVNSLAEKWSNAFLIEERRAELSLSLECLRSEKQRFAKQLSAIPEFESIAEPRISCFWNWSTNRFKREPYTRNWLTADCWCECATHFAVWLADALFASRSGPPSRTIGWSLSCRLCVKIRFGGLHEGDFRARNCFEQRKELVCDRTLRVASPKRIFSGSLQSAKHVQQFVCYFDGRRNRTGTSGPGRGLWPGARCGNESDFA